MTKEELLKINGQISDKMDYWITDDTKKRKEFAKAFNWYKKKGQYDYTEEILTPSWEEIFVEVGKLLAKENYLKFKADLESSVSAISSLWERLNEIKEVKKLKQ